MGRQTLIDSIDDRLIASPTGDYLNIFDTFDLSVSGNSVYNTNLWNGAAADLIPALTGIAWGIEGLGGGGLFPSVKAVAISRRHILTAGHIDAGIGGIRWILQDGTFVDGVTIDSINDVGIEHEFAADPDFLFQVLYLDADLPLTVPLTPIFHPSLLDASTVHVPGTNDDTQPVDAVMLGTPPVVPVCVLDQEHKMLVCDSWNTTPEAYYQYQMFSFQYTPPPGSIRLNYFEPVVVGDSGSAIFAVYGSQIIYLSAVTQSISSDFRLGPFALWFVQSIIDACATLDARNSQTGYTPEFFALPVDIGYVTSRDYATTAITVSDEAG